MSYLDPTTGSGADSADGKLAKFLASSTKTPARCRRLPLPPTRTRPNDDEAPKVPLLRALREGLAFAPGLTSSGDHPNACDHRTGW